jgi:O-antigen/teichoic acid export membrane protein
MLNFVYFGLSAAFNRGAVLLLLPLSALFLSVIDFGTFSLYIIISQVIIPFLTLNVATVIAREYIENTKDMLFLARFFNTILLCIFIVSFVVSGVFNSKFFLLIAMISSESIFAINTTVIRFEIGVKSFFYCNLAKFISLFLMMFIGWYFVGKVMENILFYMSAIIFSNLIAVMLSNIKFINLDTFALNKIKSCNRYLFFAVAFIPHIVSQWIISGFDRVFIKWSMGDVSLGVYALGYSLSSLMMLYISSLAIGLPFLCVKNYVRFSDTKVEWIILFISAVCSLFLLTALSYIVPVYYADMDSDIVLDVIYIIIPSFVFLALYHYYAADLFYHKEVKKISLLTLFIAVLNVVLVCIISLLGEVQYIAFATYISYLLYMLLASYLSTIKVKPIMMMYAVIFTLLPIFMRFG